MTAYASELQFKRPWALLGWGLALVVVLAAVWWPTRSRLVARALGAVVLLTAAVIGVSWFVVTDREQITALIERGRQAVLARDLPGVLSLIDLEAAALRREVSREFPRGRVEELAVTSERIVVQPNRQPRTATVRLIVRLRGKLAGSEAPLGLFPLALELRKSDNWLVRVADFDAHALREMGQQPQVPRRPRPK